MNTALPTHPWRHRLTRVWCSWWCSIDFPSNCCSWIYIHFLSQTSPLLVQSAKWRPHFSLLLSWKAKDISNEELSSGVREVSGLRDREGQNGVTSFDDVAKSKARKERLRRQTELAGSRNIPPWIHTLVVYSFIQHCDGAPTMDQTTW